MIDPDLNHFGDIMSLRRNCRYYSVSNYNEMAVNLKEFFIMTYNIRSIGANIDYFCTIMHNTKSYPHVLVLTEIWSAHDNDVVLNNYSTYNITRSNRRSGGVSVSIESCFSSRLIPDLSFVNDDIEVCTVSLIIK